MTISSGDRERLVRRGQALSWIGLAYNALEGLVSIIAGIIAGSVSLVGFGIDSAIETTSSVAALWRLGADGDACTRERSERIALRIVGVSFLARAVYILIDALHALLTGQEPERSIPGIVITTMSVVVMPLLASEKRKIALALGSRALRADAKQTDVCVYLSAIALGGLALNAVLHWWWADPVAALIMTPIVAREGIEGLRGEDPCGEESAHQ